MVVIEQSYSVESVVFSSRSIQKDCIFGIVFTIHHPFLYLVFDNTLEFLGFNGQSFMIFDQGLASYLLLQVAKTYKW